MADRSLSAAASPKRIVFVSVPAVRVPAVIRWPFLLFVFTLPFEAADLGFTSSTFSLTKISGLLFFVACLLYPKRCFTHPPRVLWWFLGYLTLFMLNGLNISAAFLGKFFSAFFTLTQLALLFWTAACLLREEKLVRSVLFTFSMASLLLSLGTILHTPGFGSTTEQMHTEARMTALGHNPNTLALLAVFAAVILIGLLLDKTVRSPWRKACLAVLTLPLFLLIVQTGSRAAFGALIIGISLYLLPYRGAKQKLVRMIWAVLTIVGVVCMAISNPVSSARWEKAYEGNTAGRDKIYPAAIDMISERPLFGWQPVVAQYELERRVYNAGGSKSAHNLFLHLLMEGGIVGTLPFLVALWLCVRAAWKARTGPLGMLPLALLVAVLAYCMTHSTLNKKPLWLILSLAAVSPAFVARGQKGRVKGALEKRPLPLVKIKLQA
jgi:O-antigen ligase